MAKDYGMRSKSPKTATIIVAAGVAIAAGVFAAWQMDTRNKEIAADQAAAATFNLQGAPCAALTKPAFDVLRKGRNGTQFEAEGNQFAMGYGASDCRAFNTRVGKDIGAQLVCQFRNPTWVRVTTPKTSYYFGAPASPATVAITDGEARCVLTARAAG